MRKKHWISRSEKETLLLAGRIAKKAGPGQILCLSGPLGSGKTVFARGLARGFGYKGYVSSPSFALIQVYRVRNGRRVVVYHMDWYRLKGAELAGIGLEECLLDPRGVAIVEWPEVGREYLPPRRIEIKFEILSPSKRRISMTPVGPGWGQ